MNLRTQLGGHRSSGGQTSSYPCCRRSWCWNTRRISSCDRCVTGGTGRWHIYQRRAGSLNSFERRNFALDLQGQSVSRNIKFPCVPDKKADQGTASPIDTNFELFFADYFISPGHSNIPGVYDHPAVFQEFDGTVLSRLFPFAHNWRGIQSTRTSQQAKTQQYKNGNCCSLFRDGHRKPPKSSGLLRYIDEFAKSSSPTSTSPAVSSLSPA